MKLFSGLALGVILAFAGFTAAKPPDLPDNMPIIVAPELSPANDVQSPIQQALAQSLLYTTHPIILLSGQCPYQQCPSQCQPPCPPDTAALRSVLENLEALEQCADDIEKAYELAEQGKHKEAVKCLKKAKKRCPGSSFEEKVNEALATIEIIKADQCQPCEEAAEPECEHSGCCFAQFSRCWMSQMEYWFQAKQVVGGCCAKGTKAASCGKGCCADGPKCCAKSCKECKCGEKCKCGAECEPACGDCKDCPNCKGCKKCDDCKCDKPTSCGPPCGKPCHPCKPCKPEAKAPCADLNKPVCVCYQQVPLCVVVDALRASTGVPIVIDHAAISQAGVCITHPVSVHALHLPLQIALDLVVKPIQLTTKVEGGVVVIGVPPVTVQHGCKPVAPKTEEACEPSDCEKSACPKCDEMHIRIKRKIHHRLRKKLGVKEQVDGLMKACYLAVETGRHAKAVDLARQAHALDADRVESDPLVYKLHLLQEGQKCEEQPKSVDCPAAGEPSNNYPDGKVPSENVTKCVPPLPAACVDVAAMEKAEAECYKDVLVNVKEAPTGSLMFGLGVNCDAGLTGSIIVNERNFDVECEAVEQPFAVRQTSDDATTIVDCVKAWVAGLLLAPCPKGEKNHLAMTLSTSGKPGLSCRATYAGAVLDLVCHEGIVMMWMTPAKKKDD